uniref:Peptidase S1 domain-containing protein n=1 Tax=Anopheles dirus TaxID=7168 RepID=A0A182MY32_9DIPT
MSFKWILPLFLPITLCVVSSATYDPDQRLVCGRRVQKAVYLIRDGVTAKPGQWPWHVALYHRRTPTLKYHCGGTILDAGTILTAAHCVSTGNGVLPRHQVFIAVGRTQLAAEIDHTETHAVQSIMVHPEFQINGIANDVALLKLARNVTWSRFVQPACLWNMADRESILGRNGTIVGFGITEHGVVSDQLKQVSLSVLDPLVCIADDRAVFGNHLTAEMLCARGDAHVRACEGDSGGGMFFEVGGRWFVRGVISFAPGVCGAQASDASPTNTALIDAARYLAWITQYIDPRVLPLDTDEVVVDYEEKMRLFDFETCGLRSNESDRIPWLGALLPSSTDNFVIPRVIIHPKYKSTSQEDNIALIELLNPVLEPICIPVTPRMRTNSYANLSMIVIKKGLLESTPVSYVNRTACAEMLASESFSLMQNNKQLCARMPPEDSSDCRPFITGSPLHQIRMVGRVQRIFLRGFVLHLQSCDSTKPSVYIDINEHMDWLLYSMRDDDKDRTESTSLESDWNGLMQTGKPSLMLFDMYSCGLSASLFRPENRYPNVPWIGWLHEQRPLTLTDVSLDRIAILIQDYYALASAEMVENKTQWRYLTFGAVGNYLTCPKDKDCERYVRLVSVKDITIHPNFTKHPLRHNVALIEFSTRLTLDHEFIRPICLPFTESTRSSQPITWATSAINMFHTEYRKLTLLNLTDCKQQFVQDGITINQSDISICAIDSSGDRQSLSGRSQEPTRCKSYRSKESSSIRSTSPGFQIMT